MQFINIKAYIIIFSLFTVISNYTMELDQELKLSDYIELANGEHLRSFYEPTKKAFHLAQCKKELVLRTYSVPIRKIGLNEQNVSDVRARGITLLSDNLFTAVLTAKLVSENDTLVILNFNYSDGKVSVGVAGTLPEANFLDVKLFRSKKDIIVKAIVCCQNKYYRELQSNCNFDECNQVKEWTTLNQYNPIVKP